jgi:hypothetical protein
MVLQVIFAAFYAFLMKKSVISVIAIKGVKGQLSNMTEKLGSSKKPAYKIA